MILIHREMGPDVRRKILPRVHAASEIELAEITLVPRPVLARQPHTPHLTRLVQQKERSTLLDTSQS